MLESMEIVKVLPVPDEMDPAVREAKASQLRNQQIEPRIIEVGRFRYRISIQSGCLNRSVFSASPPSQARWISSSTTIIHS